MCVHLYVSKHLSLHVDADGDTDSVRLAVAFSRRFGAQKAAPLHMPSNQTTYHSCHQMAKMPLFSFRTCRPCH